MKIAQNHIPFPEDTKLKFLSPEPDSPARDALADLRAQRLREELPLQDHKRSVARLQGLPQKASFHLHVLYTTGKSCHIMRFH